MSKQLKWMETEDANPPHPERARASLLSRESPSVSASKQWAGEEALRLVQRIFLPQNQEPPRVVVFASIDPGAGCSQMCASVAETLAACVERSVCLVDGNLRTPRLPELFRVTNHYGLTNSLLEEGPVSAFTTRLTIENLRLLSAGKDAPDTTSLLSSRRFEERMKELRTAYPFVLVDAPPLNRYSDALLFSRYADGLVLVLEAGVTRRETAASVVANLHSMGIPILGAVLNKREYPIPQGIYRRL